MRRRWPPNRGGRLVQLKSWPVSVAERVGNFNSTLEFRKDSGEVTQECASGCETFPECDGVSN